MGSICWGRKWQGPFRIWSSVMIILSPVMKKDCLSSTNCSAWPKRFRYRCAPPFWRWLAHPPTRTSSAASAMESSSSSESRRRRSVLPPEHPRQSTQMRPLHSRPSCLEGNCQHSLTLRLTKYTFCSLQIKHEQREVTTNYYIARNATVAQRALQGLVQHFN